MNATQEEHNVVTITLISPMFGMTEVESRVNISRGRFSTLECVAAVEGEGEQDYILFAIGGEWSRRLQVEVVSPHFPQLQIFSRNKVSAWIKSQVWSYNQGLARNLLGKQRWS